MSYWAHNHHHTLKLFHWPSFVAIIKPTLFYPVLHGPVSILLSPEYQTLRVLLCPVHCKNLQGTPTGCGPPKDQVQLRPQVCVICTVPHCQTPWLQNWVRGKLGVPALWAPAKGPLSLDLNPWLLGHIFSYFRLFSVEPNHPIFLTAWLSVFFFWRLLLASHVFLMAFHFVPWFNSQSPWFRGENIVALRQSSKQMFPHLLSWVWQCITFRHLSPGPPASWCLCRMHPEPHSKQTGSSAEPTKAAAVAF